VRATGKTTSGDDRSGLAAEMPEVEVVDLDVHGGRSGRLTFTSTGGGVDIALCERSLTLSTACASSFALDVSSPGLDRPLRTPAQFARPRARECM